MLLTWSVSIRKTIPLMCCIVALAISGIIPATAQIQEQEFKAEQPTPREQFYSDDRLNASIIIVEGDVMGACCKPAEATGDACENLNEEECNAVEPVDEPRIWQVGLQCNQQGQRCPIPECYAGQGACDEELPKRCMGGPLDGEACDLDRDCQGYCDIDNMTCIGGDRDGLVCSDNSNCPDGMCRGFCLGGVLEGDRCLADFGCEADFTSGACFFSGGDPTGFCEGGDRDGESCFSDSDCKGTTCDCLPGCADPLCCTDVCTSLDPFCCDVCWDETCTLEAQTICRVDCNDNGISDDEDISAGTSPDVNLNSIPDECENGSCCFEDGNCRITKGMNCTSEVWTLHGTCIPYPCPPVGGACCDNSLGLGGVCTDNVFFEDCRGRHLWWTINTKCSEITCKEVTGACCDRYYGVCQDDVQQQHCTGKLLNWKEGKNCQNSKCIRACCYRRLHNCDESLNLPDCDDVTRDARTR